MTRIEESEMVQAVAELEVPLSSSQIEEVIERVLHQLARHPLDRVVELLERHGAPCVCSW